MHNDFHFGNILIDTSIKEGGSFKYVINNTNFYIPNYGFIPKLWDFEYTMVYSNNLACHPNKFVLGPLQYDSKNHKTIEDLDLLDLGTNDDPLNVPLQYNEVYDLHYFLTSLLELYDFPNSIKIWIRGLYPEVLIPEFDESCYSRKSSGSFQSNNESERSSSESTRSSRSYDTETSQGSSSYDVEETDYLYKGRIKNGKEAEFPNLPTPATLLNDDFFSEFRTNNSDYIVSEFNAGI